MPASLTFTVRQRENAHQRVIFFSLLFTLQCCAAVLGNVSRDTIFLRAYSAASIPSLTLLLSCFTAMIMSKSSKIFLYIANLLLKYLENTNALARFLCTKEDAPNIVCTDMHRTIAVSLYLYAIRPAILSCILLLLTTISLCIPDLASWVSIAIYMWVEVTAQLMTQQFWELCTKFFDVSESKKYFGIITFGSTIGSLLASFVFLPLIQSRRFSVEWNLVLASFFQFQVSLLVIVLLKSNEVLLIEQMSTEMASLEVYQNKGAGKATQRRPKSHNGDQHGGVWFIRYISAEIFSRTYLLHICFFDFSSSIVRILVDNSTLSILSDHDESQVKAALTKINGLQGIIMIPLQLVSGTIFSRYGVMLGMTLLPVAVGLYGVAVFLIVTASVGQPSGLYLLIFHRALYYAISLAIFNPARELLWLPFNEQERSRFKNFVYGPFRSIARIIGALLSIVLSSSTFAEMMSSSSLSALLITLSCVWFADTLFARKSYAGEFYLSLKRGYLDLRSHIVDFTPDQVSIVKETLSFGAQDQVKYVISSLAPSDVPLFAQELRALFYKKDQNNASVTPLNIKLRLVKLHTLARKEFVLTAQDTFLVPVGKTVPGCIFNSMDLMLLIAQNGSKGLVTLPSQESSLHMQGVTPQHLRVAAILACGYEKFSGDKEQCIRMLRKLVAQERQDADDNLVAICAAVALLRLTDWMDEHANIILQRLLHDEKNSQSRAICLKVVGEELPELLGDGFLVYLLHHDSDLIIQATIECCVQSCRQARMLIPAMIRHLGSASLQPQIIRALSQFEAQAVWVALTQFLELLRSRTKDEESLKSPKIISHAGPMNILSRDWIRSALRGALSIVEVLNYQVNIKLNLIISLLRQDTESLSTMSLFEYYEQSKHDIGWNKSENSETNLSLNANHQISRNKDKSSDLLHLLFGSDVRSEELLVDSLLSILAAVGKKEVLAYSSILEPLSAVMDANILWAYKMIHVLHLFKEMCPHSAKNIKDTSPLLLQHVQHSINDARRIILKLSAVSFPKEFNVAVIIDEMDSQSSQVQSAISEVLDSLLPLKYKDTLLPLMLSSVMEKKVVNKISMEAETYFEGKRGLELLFENMRREQSHAELSNLTLQYFLHIMEHHPDLVTPEDKQEFETEVLPHLLTEQIARELIIEIINKNQNLISESQLIISKAEPATIISRVAGSIIFENVYVIDILRSLSGQFAAVQVQKGEWVFREDHAADTMFIIASGTVQLHKCSHVLSELGYGACIGQDSLFRKLSRTENYIASATALTDCTLLSISRNMLISMMHENDRVSLGVLRSVAYALQCMYFEPLRAIKTSGSLPQRQGLPTYDSSVYYTERRRSSEPNADNLKVIFKEAVLNGQRPRLSYAPVAISQRRNSMVLDGTFKSKMHLTSLKEDPPTASRIYISQTDSYAAPMTTLVSSTSGIYTIFEKCIELKALQLMRDVQDDKVSLVAQVARVITLQHEECLYTEGESADHLYIIIHGKILITHCDSLQTTQEYHDGEYFGEESVEIKAIRHGEATSMGRCTLFELPVKELIELGQNNLEIMQVLLACLAEKISKSTEAIVKPFDLISETISPRAKQRKKAIKG